MHVRMLCDGAPRLRLCTMQHTCLEARRRKAQALARHSADDVGRCLVKVQAKAALARRLAAKAQSPPEVADEFRYRILKIL